MSSDLVPGVEHGICDEPHRGGSIEEWKIWNAKSEAAVDAAYAKHGVTEGTI